MKTAEQHNASKVGHYKFTPKPKQPKSISFQTFPKQFEKLHPERSKAGGIKARSASEEVRMGIYRDIAAMFKRENRLCQACQIIHDKTKWVQLTEDIHHVQGRGGLQLFDIRHWLAVCRSCHSWIHANPKRAHKLGLLEKEI